jgi:hypothetical protein
MTSQGSRWQVRGAVFSIADRSTRVLKDARTRPDPIRGWTRPPHATAAVPVGSRAAPADASTRAATRPTVERAETPAATALAASAAFARVPRALRSARTCARTRARTRTTAAPAPTHAAQTRFARAACVRVLFRCPNVAELASTKAPTETIAAAADRRVRDRARVECASRLQTLARMRATPNPTPRWMRHPTAAVMAPRAPTPVRRRSPFISLGYATPCGRRLRRYSGRSIPLRMPEPVFNDSFQVQTAHWNIVPPVRRVRRHPPSRRPTDICSSTLSKIRLRDRAAPYSLTIVPTVVPRYLSSWGSRLQASSIVMDRYTARGAPERSTGTSTSTRNEAVWARRRIVRSAVMYGPTDEHSTDARDRRPYRSRTCTRRSALRLPARRVRCRRGK